MDFKDCCHNCEYRHGGCNHTEQEVLATWDGIPCGDFVLGSCFSCVVYQDGQDAMNNLCDDVFFPSKCNNFKLGKPQVY